jgi:hypothetical protein
MKPGDPIWYRPTLRGYSYDEHEIPGEFVRATARRFVIKLWLKDGSRVDVAVTNEKVRPRDPDTTAGSV